MPQDVREERPLRLDDERPLAASTAALVAELDGLVPSHQVISCVLACREDLRAAGVREGLATATVAMARARLLPGTTAIPLAG